MARSKTATMVGEDSPILKDTTPISIYKTPERKRVAKAKVDHEGVDLVVTGEAMTVVPEAAPVVEEPVEEPKAKAERTERVCPGHSELWPEEGDVRPMSEYQFNKTTGKLLSGYCKRCNSKRHSMYNKQPNADRRGPGKDQLLNEALQRIDVQAQIEELEAKNTQLEEQLAAQQ